ncbi:hypothetical protein vseg_003058 [Gypsophila vaccaria]
MAMMSEKTSRSSRLFMSVIGFSMVSLVLSSFFLFHSVISPLIPSSVFEFVVVGEERVYVDSEDGSDPIEPLDALFSPSLVIDSNETKDLTTGNNPACDKTKALLRVYMYDMSSEFHFGLLDWKASPNGVWPDVSNPIQVPRYPGGLNLQHSVEYWLTLDLLSSNIKEIVRPCTVFRVKSPSEADVIFVPFFSSLSYNRHSKVDGNEKVSLNRKLQIKLVEFLMRRPEWRKSKGKDHVIIAHHPNSMLYARKKLGSARFVLSDFGRYAAKTANLAKDVIAPYKHVVKSVSSNSSAPFESRPTLIYFQGAIFRKDGGAIRQELYYLLKDEKDVHFTFGNTQRSGVRDASQGMGSSKFCLNIAGDTPSSNRLFDAIVSHCVPVIISDDIELPYEDVLDYSEFSVFVWASDAVKEGFLLNLLCGISMEEWTKMWERLKQVAHHFEYHYPSQPGDAVDMIWQALARKRLTVLNMNHTKRQYRMS